MYGGIITSLHSIAYGKAQPQSSRSVFLALSVLRTVSHMLKTSLVVSFSEDTPVAFLNAVERPIFITKKLCLI